MPLIATAEDPAGCLRIFFDLRPVATTPEEVVRISHAIERAFNANNSEPSVTNQSA